MIDTKCLALLGGTPLIKETLPKWPLIDDDDVNAVLNTLQNEELSAYEVNFGPLYDFEKELRNRFKTEYALLVGSGTAALQSAIFALSIGPGDEVIVPAIGYPGTASVVLHAGATVRFADVEADTGNPSLENIKREITEHTKAVILAHAWGIPANFQSIIPYLKSRNIYIIEDCSRAFGSTYNGQEVGTFGDLACFSFHELKAVPAGEGGLLLTNNRDLYERAVALGHYFRCKDPIHLSKSNMSIYRDSGLGLNLKIHPIAASLARSQLGKLDKRLDEMFENHLQLSKEISRFPYLKIQEKPKLADKISYYGFNFHWLPPENENYPSLSTLVAAFRAEGLEVSQIGSPPLFQLPLFKNSMTDDAPLLGRTSGYIEDKYFPGAIAHANSLLRFPTLFTRDSNWIKKYIAVLEKINSNLYELALWEKENKLSKGDF